MKIKELFEEYSPEPEDDTERQTLLKRLIDSGRNVHVRDAKYLKGNFSLGDVEAIGYGEFVEKRRGKSYESYFKYTGPLPIILVTDTADVSTGRQGFHKTVLNPGAQTKPEVVDYT